MVADHGITRRRTISLLAAVALPAFARRARAGDPEPFRWRGIVLGAEADLTLYAADRAQAADALAAALSEIARLEGIFSLYRTDSALVRLNRAGRLDAAPFELRELMGQAVLLAESSGGRFDPTVQPLWRLYADHFGEPDADPAGPAAVKLAAVRRAIDYRGVRLDDDAIVFDRPGMQVTLNGIAQGYISDRIGALLKGRGFTHALVNLGEALAIGRRADGGAWTIGVPAPDDRARLVTELELAEGAVATSAARGLLFDGQGRFNHIIDPGRMACADPDRAITVLAPTAAIADGLSTLGALLPDPKRELPQHLAAYGARAFMLATRDEVPAWI